MECVGWGKGTGRIFWWVVKGRIETHVSWIVSSRLFGHPAMGALDGTSNDWTHGSLTFISGHYAQDVIEGNRSLWNKFSCGFPPNSVVRSKLCKQFQQASAPSSNVHPLRLDGFSLSCSDCR